MMHTKYSKVQINHLFHKKSYGYCLIIPNVVSSTKNAHLYENEIHPTWTPIKPIYKDIQIGSKSFHIIRRTQFPIQLVTSCGSKQDQRSHKHYFTLIMHVFFLQNNFFHINDFLNKYEFVKMYKFLANFMFHFGK